MPPPDPNPAFRRFQQHGRAVDLAAVFDATAAELLRVATHLVGDAASAEDLVQATFLVAIEKRGAFDPHQDVTPWLLGILHNRVRRHRQFLARRPDPTRLRQGLVEDPLLAAQGRELDKAISDAIAQLPEPYRPVLRMHLRHGLGAAEIAVDLGRAPATVRKQLQRGLHRLRGLLPLGILGLGACQAHGLAVMRESVLAAAPTTSVLSAGLGLLGLTAMQKTAAVFLLGLLGLWIYARGTPSVAGADLGQPVDPGGATQLARTPDGPVAEEVAGAPSRVPLAAGAGTAGSTKTPGKGLFLEGRLETSSGSPIAGAGVWMPEHGEAQRRRPLRRTDEGGRFVIEDAPVGGYFFFVAEGFPPSQYQLVEGDPGQRQQRTFVLVGRAMQIEAQVFGPDGRPVEGAEVLIGKATTASVMGWHGTKRILPAAALRLFSDRQGRFRSGSARWGAAVAVYKKGLAPWLGRLPNAGPGRASAGVERLEVTLHPAAALWGRVRTAGGEPVEGARVRQKNAYELPRWLRKSVRTDVKGEFLLEDLSPGSCRLELVAPGFHRIDKELQLVAGARHEWTPVLRRAPQIRGQLIGPRGRPLIGYQLEARPESGRRQKARSDADGRFCLQGCTEASYRLRVLPPGSWGGWSLHERSGLRPDTGELRLQLSEAEIRTGKARGIIRRADGSPAGRLQCSLWREPYSWGRMLHSEVKTGLVDLDCLPAGEYRLIVRMVGRMPYRYPFVVRPGETTRLDDLVLHDPASLDLRLDDTAGTPVDGVHIAVFAGKQLVKRAAVKAGRAMVGGLPKGSLEIRSSGSIPEQRLGSVELSWGQTRRAHLQLEVTWPRVLRFDTGKPRDLELSYRILDAAGTELHQARSRWPAGMPARAGYRFRSGRYTVEVRGMDGRKGRGAFEVKPGPAVAEIRIPLR